MIPPSLEKPEVIDFGSIAEHTCDQHFGGISLVIVDEIDL